MRDLKQSTARNVMVFVALSSDHISGATGKTLTITASKDGAEFASITPTVTERGNGWYSLALTTAHTDTLGDLAFHITAADSDPLDFICQVVENLAADVFDRLGEPAGASLAADIADIAGYLDTEIAGIITAVANLSTALNVVDDLLDTEFPALTAAVALVRKMLTNRMVVDADALEQIHYDDDDTTPIVTFDLTEFPGGGFSERVPQ